MINCVFVYFLIQKWHPDRRGMVPWLVEAEAKRRFQLIQEAYEGTFSESLLLLAPKEYKVDASSMAVIAEYKFII
jgi:curved DNA-binding protein CbpA